MKRSKTIRWSLSVVLLLLVAQPLTADMDLSLKAKRKTYLLGEPVSVTLKAKNTSREAVVTDVVLAPEAGFVQFFISDDGEKFEQYLGPGWGIRDVFLRPRPVDPGASFEYQVDLLWHHVVPGDNQILKRALVFSEEHCYLVKAKVMLPEFNRESNTIEICTTTPKGPDLAVWNSFVAEPELARFVQRPLTDVPDKIRERVQALLQQNPSSAYAPYLEKALRERREFDAQAGR